MTSPRVTCLDLYLSFEEARALLVLLTINKGFSPHYDKILEQLNGRIKDLDGWWKSNMATAPKPWEKPG